MIRVLHLTTVAPNLDAMGGIAALRSAAYGFGAAAFVGHRTIGRGGDYRNVVHAAMGLRADRRRFDVIHAWGSTAALAASASGKPIVVTPDAPLSGSQMFWMRALARDRPIHLAFTSAAAARRCHMYDQAASTAFHVVRPATDVSGLAAGRNDTVRAALGISPEDVVLLAPGESTRPAGHRLALHAVSILHVLSARYRLLVWGRGREAEMLARLAASVRQPALLVDATRRLGQSVEPELLFGAADLALVTSSEPVGATALAMCMAGGLPIVGHDTPWIRERLEDGRTAALVTPGSPRLLAQRVLSLIEHPREAAALGAAAREQAERSSGLERFRSDIAAVYELAARVEPRGADPQRMPSHRAMSPDPFEAATLHAPG